MLLLWSDRGEAQARQSLRQTIAVARRALRAAEADIIDSDLHTVSIDLGNLKSDVAVFQRLTHESSLEELEQAATLYTGEFLAGLVVRDPLAADWLSDRRAEFQSQLIRCLGSLLAAYNRLEQHDGIEQTASRLLDLDPLDEEAHRALMSVYLARGQRSLAFRQLQRCRKSLMQDLSIAPSPETEVLIKFPIRGKTLRADAAPRTDAKHDCEDRASSLSKPSGWTAGVLTARNDRENMNGRAPSLIVTPFEVIGDGRRGDLMAYGLVDDIVVDLSRFSSLFVLPPGPVVSLNLHPVDPLVVGSALEVQYVLTGSVQEMGDRLRIVATLLDAENGHVLWGERYDRQLVDFFEVRDDLSRRIAIAASSSAEASDYERLRQRDTDHFGAWELCTLAQRMFLAYRPECNAEARSLFHRALELDPGFARAAIGLGWTHVEDFCFRWSDNPQRSLQHAHDIACQVKASEPRHYKARYLLSFIEFFRRQLEVAVEECTRARADNPNDPELLLHEGFLMACTGRAKNGIKRAEEALCLNPCHPDWFHYIHGIIALEAGLYEKSLAALTRYIDLSCGPFVGLKANALRFRVAAHALAGELEAARRDANIYLAADPKFGVSAYVQGLQRLDPTSIERMTSALRSAGLPA